MAGASTSRSACRCFGRGFRALLLLFPFLALATAWAPVPRKKKALLAHGAKATVTEAKAAELEQKRRQWDEEDLKAEEQLEEQVALADRKRPMPDAEMNALVKALFKETKAPLTVEPKQRDAVKELLLRATIDGDWETARAALFADRDRFFAQSKSHERLQKKIFDNFEDYVGAFRKKWRKQAGLPKATWQH